MRLGKVLTSVVFGSLLLACNLTLYRTHAYAQEYPSRNVTIIVPFPAGGGNDIFARLIGQRLAAAFGRTVIVDNRPGASGNIGAEAVVRAAPDGHTILYGNANVATTQVVPPKPAFDPQRDLAPVSMTVLIPFVLVAHPSLPVRNVKDLLALAKAQPGNLTFSAVTGSITHLAMELLKLDTKLDARYVPYKGAAPAITDIVGGQGVDGIAVDLSAVLPFVKSGKLRALGVTSERRNAEMPNVRTMAEQGLPELSGGNWFAVLGPAKLPPALVATLHGALVKVVASPDFKEKLVASGSDPLSSDTPEALKQLIKSEFARWGRVVKAANIQSE